jgi:hypothetical protein
MEQPQQPLPALQFGFAQDGVVLRIVLGNGLVIEQSIGENVMNEICSRWLETRREVKRHLALIEDIKKSRND